MNNTDRIKSQLNKRGKNGTVLRAIPMRKVVYAVIFIFTLAVAACQSFFGTYPFGIASVSAVSGLFGAASAAAGAVIGSLLSPSGYGGYLAVLSILLFAARLVISWWLHSETEAQPAANVKKRPANWQNQPNRQNQRMTNGRNRVSANYRNSNRNGVSVHNNKMNAEAANSRVSGAKPVIDTGQAVTAAPVMDCGKRVFDINRIADIFRNADGALLRENIVVRMAVGTLASMFMGVLSAAEGGFAYYDLFGAIFSVLLSPAVVYMIYAATERHMRVSRIREAGIYTMAALFTYALSGISPDWFNFGYAFAFAASLAAGTSYGSFRGLVTGLFCGILLEPVYAPLFAITAGVCGLFYQISSQLAVMASLSCGIAWGIYVSGFDALRRLVPPLAIASAVMLPLYYFDLVRLPPNLFGLTKNVGAAERGTISEVIHHNTSKQLGELSGSMKSISQIVYSLAVKLGKPTQCEMRELCEYSFERYCSKCAMHPTCYGAAYDKTAALIARLSSELYKYGTVSAGAVPPAFAKKCYNIGRILDELNFQSSKRCAALSSEDKLSVVAGDYEMMGELLRECLDYDKNEMKEDKELTAKLARLLTYNNFRAGRVTAYGVRHKRIFVSDIDLGNTRLGGDDIRRLFESICGFPLSQPEFELDGTVVSMRLSSVYQFSAESGRASVSASDAVKYDNTLTDDSEPSVQCEDMEADSHESINEFGEGEEESGENKKAVYDTASEADLSEENVTSEEIKVEVTDEPPTEPSGDVINSFEADGKYYMLISDGMGSGREAALTSSIAAMFLERMLTSGASMETSLKMLNKLIRAGERECSATIDLAEIDLKTGEARFVKSGAAPSFVIRDGSIYRLQSKTVPIGIIRALDAEMIKFSIEEGDIIVMLSDGVARSFEECPWLLEMLTSDNDILSGDPRLAAEKIVKSAAERGSRDDITAGVLRIKSA